MDCPDPISAYLFHRTADTLHLAYFLLDSSGSILGWGGALDHYRIQEPRKGLPIADRLIFAEGMFPMEEGELILECVELPGGVTVDAHFFKDQGDLWLLLLDAADKSEKRRLLQQKANELILLRDAHARILDQHLGKWMVERLLRIDSKKGGQRRVLAVLFADIRGFTTYCEERASVEVFQMLNAYLTAMIQPVLEGGGIVDKIIGDAVMAVFGLLPSGLSAPGMAVAVAGEILKHTNTIAAARQKAGQPALGVGVGIATGPVVFGFLGSHDRRTLSVTGHSVNLAARLESRASPGEILIDESTFDALNAEVSRFFLSSRKLYLKGMLRPITAYGWMIS